VINPDPITPVNGKGLTFVGYGIAARNRETLSGVLRKATLNVLPASSCKLPARRNFADAFCAILPNASPCFGTMCFETNPLACPSEIRTDSIPTLWTVVDGGGPLIDRNGKLVGLYMPDSVGMCKRIKPFWMNVTVSHPPPFHTTQYWLSLARFW